MSSSSASLGARLTVALLVLSCLALGCAEERDAINRVQANALAKSFFVGELHDPADDPDLLLPRIIAQWQ